MFGVFGDEALRRRGEPEIGHAADQQHPGPGINVDAEFEAAHPAREQNLRDKGDRRRGHANDESGAGKTPHQRRVAAVGEQRMGPRHRAVDLFAPRDGRRQTPGRAPNRTRRVLGTDRCHRYLCAAASWSARRSDRRQGTVNIRLEEINNCASNSARSRSRAYFFLAARCARAAELAATAARMSALNAASSIFSPS